MDNLQFGELSERLRQQWLCVSALASHPGRQTWLIRHRERAEQAVLKVRTALRSWGRRVAPTEIRLAKLLRHPQIPVCLEWGWLKAGRVYLIESFVDGPSIHRAIEQLDSSLEVRTSTAIDWLVESARLIETLHEHGWIHGDLCPRHLLIERRTHRPHLIDFDCALPAGELPRGRGMRGTLGYASPSALTGKPASLADDAFSWGVVAWECLTGRLPWTLQGDLSSYLMQVQAGERGGSDRLTPEVSPVLDQALRFDEQSRPSLTQLRQLLQATRSSLS